MDIEVLVAAVEAAGADIAPGYAEYVQLAFALATDCGERGREYFHRLCRLSVKYQREQADRLYDNALSQGRGDVHLATAFHLARQAGVRVEAERHAPTGLKNGSGPASLTHARTCTREEDGGEATEAEEELVGSEPLSALPVMPDADWPEPLKSVLSVGRTPAQRDVLLLGALTVLGASLNRTVRMLYGGKWQSPCLQTFVVAPPASGKGLLSLVRLLVEPIHDEIRAAVAEQMKVYRMEKAKYDVMGKERANATQPQLPPNRMFIISGNNSGTGILQNIMDSGGTGLICEAEADTVSAAIGSDYGQWSDTLRKAFDHERLSYNRRTDREYREVKKSYLSVLLSGTPAQVKPLIPSAENGLFSRQLFYYMPAIREWRDQFDVQNENLEELFEGWGKRWKQELAWLKLQGLFTLLFSAEQKAQFNRLFEGLFREATLFNGYEMNSSVARLGINVCRICTVVALLRVLEGLAPLPDRPSGFGASEWIRPCADTTRDNLKDGIVTRWDLRMADADFEAVLGLVEPLYAHALHVLSFLPGTMVKRRVLSDCERFFRLLPQEFTRRQMLELAAAQGVKENTALTWLKRMLRHGVVLSKGLGCYCFACARII